MNINVSIRGLDEVISDFTEKGVKAQFKADKITETYARKMANESADMAPVDTGDLRTSIAASPRKLKPAHWEYGSNLAYARRQEYEHRSNKGFIRRSVWNNRTPYRDALRREVVK